MGRAPNFTGITAWFNTPGNQPLSLSDLKGKVVLVDFWTYSCINCQRALPHVEGWYNDYKKDGLVVVGVSSPEFAFEHVVSNVKSAATGLGIDYPVAVDDNLATWDAYNNEYWPAEYLIDPTGVVRAYDFGEGGYGTMESNIRMLLTANGVTDLPPRTDVPDKTPTSEAITPESYVGYERLSKAVGTSVVDGQGGRVSPAVRRSPRTAWPSAVPGPSTARRPPRAPMPRSALQFTADDVYLVMSGQGNRGRVRQRATSHDARCRRRSEALHVALGFRLQTGSAHADRVPGVEAYDFTFG